MIWLARSSSWFNENVSFKKSKVNAVGVVGLVENMISGALKDRRYRQIL